MQKTLKNFVLLAGMAAILAGCNVPLIPLI
jgi:hypothetical protein